ncbi:hypothetical protein PRIEUP_LOCUS1815 [Pristimantis euphronides]
MTQDQRKNLTKRVCLAYKYSFDCQVGDQDKTWAPPLCCTVCYSGLTQWLNGKIKGMTFAVPMVWHEQKNHLSDCYFGMTTIAGYSTRNTSKIVYPDCESALTPVPPDVENPVAAAPPAAGRSMDTDASDPDEEEDVDWHDESPDPEPLQGQPHLLSQSDLEDLVRDLSLSKEKSELLASRLREWNLLHGGTTSSHFRHRLTKLASYYEMESDVCFCTNVNCLMMELDGTHIPDHWRLFIDSSKTSWKAVLLHNGNEKPSVLLAHAVGMRETHASMEFILKMIQYSEHKWKICADRKVVALLLGLQLGYTKHMCFLCLWNSRDDKNHYKTRSGLSESDTQMISIMYNTNR